MTSDDMVDRLVLEHGLNRYEARDFVTLLFAEAKQMIEENRPVRFAGFGTLKRKATSRAKNPLGLETDITHQTWLSFTASNKLKARVHRALYEDARQEMADADRYRQYQAWLADQNSQPLEAPAASSEDPEESDTNDVAPSASSCAGSSE